LGYPAIQHPLRKPAAPTRSKEPAGKSEPDYSLRNLQGKKTEDATKLKEISKMVESSAKKVEVTKKLSNRELCRPEAIVTPRKGS
jgi:hypothetical protein